MAQQTQPTAMGRPPALDLALLTVAVVAVSTSGPLVREASAPSLAVAFWRNALALPVLGIVFVARHRGAWRAASSHERRLCVVAGAFLAAHFATWIPSLSYTTVASSVALVATQPVWAAIIARLRGNAVPAAAWLGIVIAFVGAVILSGVDLSISTRALFGDGLAMVGGLLAAAYVTVGAEARQTLSTTVYATTCYAVAAMALLVMCVVSQQELTGYDPHSWRAIVGIVVAAQLLGHTVVNRVLRTTSPTVVSVAILFEILGSTLIAWWWFDETPPGGAIPAAILIAIGVVLVVRAGREPAAPID